MNRILPLSLLGGVLFIVLTAAALSLTLPRLAAAQGESAAGVWPDSNGNGVVDRSEVINVIRLYFSGGPIPASESPLEPSLDESELANLWIEIGNNDLGILSVHADPAFDVLAYGLDVIVDGIRYCTSVPINAADGYLLMECGTRGGSHTEVDIVSAHTFEEDLRCARHVASDSNGSVFACHWR